MGSGTVATPAQGEKQYFHKILESKTDMKMKIIWETQTHETSRISCLENCRIS